MGIDFENPDSGDFMKMGVLGCFTVVGIGILVICLKDRKSVV